MYYCKINKVIPYNQIFFETKTPSTKSIANGVNYLTSHEN